MTLYRLAAKQNYEQNHIKSLPKYLPQNLDQICLDNFFRRIRTVLRANLTNRISNVVYPAVCVNHLMVCDIEKLVEFIINALKKIHFKNSNDEIFIRANETMLEYEFKFEEIPIHSINALEFTISNNKNFITNTISYCRFISDKKQTTDRVIRNYKAPEEIDVIESHYGLSYIKEPLGYIFVFPQNIYELCSVGFNKYFASLDDIVFENENEIANAQEQALFKIIKSKNIFKDLTEVERAINLSKIHHANKLRKSGEPFYLHSIELTQIMLSYVSDHDTIIASLLHDLMDDNLVLFDHIEQMFNTGVAKIVAELNKIKQESILAFAKPYLQNPQIRIDKFKESACKIKICSRAHNVRTLHSHSKEKQIEIATETLEYFVPLAIKLDMEKLSIELSSFATDVLNRLNHEA